MGSISNTQKFTIFKLDSFTCQYCGKKRPDVTLEVDHIVPVSKGGLSKIVNMVTSCKACNSSKNNSILETYPDTILEAILRRHEYLKTENKCSHISNQNPTQKTSQLFGKDVITDNKTGLLNATELIKSITKLKIMVLEPPSLTISSYFRKTSTAEFIEELLKTHNENEIIVNTGSECWVHPFIFIDIALSASTKLKYEVYNWIFNNQKIKILKE